MAVVLHRIEADEHKHDLANELDQVVYGQYLCSQEGPVIPSGRGFNVTSPLAVELVRRTNELATCAVDRAPKEQSQSLTRACFRRRHERSCNQRLSGVAARM